MLLITLLNTGDAYSIQLALAGMRAAYEQQNGYEGTDVDR